MDDLELEARLRTHLHHRLDDTPIPAGLASNVSQALTTAARPVGLATRTGRIRLGWAAVAAAVVVAVAAVGIGKGLGPVGPGAHPTPAPSALPDRVFVVLPPTGTAPDKGAASLAGDVMSARLQALGIGNFTSGTGYGIEYFVPPDGPSDAAIRAALTATGDVRFVPLPAADYGDGKLVATVGDPLPKDEPALFGWEGIATVTIGANQQGLAELDVTLRAAAAQAVDVYTQGHVGESFAIVVDGRVAAVPMIMSPISGGQIALSLGQAPGANGLDGAIAVTAAILVGGELPEAWRGATSPVLISRAQAEQHALTGWPGATVQDASLSVEETHLFLELQVVWNVTVDVPECSDLDSCAWAPGPYVAKVDAVTGTVIEKGPSAP